MTCDYLYLSPHLDDAALSCPVTIRDQRREGARVVIASFFSEGPGHERRRAEEARAAQLLDCELELLGLTDAPWRTPPHDSFLSIVFGAPDPAAAGQVREALSALLDRHKPMNVIAPLAVGTHVDHRLVHAAAREFIPDRLLFYEDRPYALVTPLLALRLKQLGLDPPMHPWPEVERALLEAPFVRRFLRPEDQPAAMRAFREEGAPAGKVAFGRVTLGDAEALRHALSVASCFPSQIPDFYGSLDALHSALEICAGERGFRVYFEAFWAPS